MPSRTRSQPNVLDTRVYQKFNNNAWQSIGGGLVSNTDTVTADYPEWDWRTRIALGLNSTTTLTGTKFGYSRDYPRLDAGRLPSVRSRGIGNAGGLVTMQTYLLSGGVRTNINNWAVKGGFASSNLQFYTDPLLLARVDDEAIIGFRRKLARVRSYLQGAVALGELRQTIRLLRHPLRDLRQLFNAYSHGLARRLGTQRRPLGDLNDVIRNTWLEYSFGMRPLVDDLDAIRQLAYDVIVERPPRKRTQFIAHGYSTENGVAALHIDSNGVIRISRYREKRRHYVSVQYKGAVKLATDTLSGAVGVSHDRLTHFIPDIYELIPFSWLLDYATNLGSIVEALSVGTGDISWMQRTERHYRDTKWSAVETSSLVSNPWKYEWGDRYVGDIGTRYWQTVNRSPYYGSLLPSFRWRLPSHLGQWLNVAAIGHMFATQSQSIQRRNLRI